MHYLHGYFAVYGPKPSDHCLLRRGMLLVSIMGLALKVVFQDYILEHLPIREQLALFDVNSETVNPAGSSSDASGRTHYDSRSSTAE